MADDGSWFAGGSVAHSAQKSIAVLYRILGNDLPPRHGERQTLRNLEFMLQHEPRHPGLERAWLVNRVFCADAEREIVDLLCAAGERYIHIPFELEAYGRITPDFSHFEGEDYAILWTGEVPDGYQRILAHDHAFHAQNCYLMNVNGARNAAIRDGLLRANWVLPWDGNCFLTADAWAVIRAACESADETCRYLISPMERLLDNADLLSTDAVFPALEEPQVAIRADAMEWFDEDLRYGRFSKVELLRRIGVPGVWDGWNYQPWEGRQWREGAETSAWRYCGWAARLASGRPEFDRDPSAAGIRHRSFARRASIRAGVARADRALVEAAFAGERSFLDLTAVDARRLAWAGDARNGPEIAGLVSRAEAALTQPPRTVLQKTRCAADGDWRSYHSVAPFWWPDPAGPERPYVRWDGRRVPEAELGHPESLAYDATRLQGVFEDAFLLAWAHYATGGEAFSAKAAAVVTAWFCDPVCAMHPNLDFAQVRRGRPRAGGQASGVIEARDIYLLLDGVALLQRLGRLPHEIAGRFHGWCGRYLNWLLDSPLGRTERSALNNHGTCYEIQVLALSRFLGLADVFAEAANRARSRVFQQFGAAGGQPEEVARHTALHYKLFNLQSWLIVARLLECGGLELAPAGGAGAVRLSAAVEALGDDVRRWRAEVAAVETWPLSTAERLEAIRAGAARYGWADAAESRSLPARWLWPHPYSGAPPLWPLAFPQRGSELAGQEGIPLRLREIAR